MRSKAAGAGKGPPQSHDSFSGNGLADGVVRPVSQKYTTALTASGKTLKQRLQRFLATIFLPAGYPQSVAPEYLKFQGWNIIQDLSTYLRGILATQVGQLMPELKTRVTSIFIHLCTVACVCTRLSSKALAWARLVSQSQLVVTGSGSGRPQEPSRPWLTFRRV